MTEELIQYTKYKSNRWHHYSQSSVSILRDCIRFFDNFLEFWSINPFCNIYIDKDKKLLIFERVPESHNTLPTSINVRHELPDGYIRKNKRYRINKRLSSIIKQGVYNGEIVGDRIIVKVEFI